MSTIYQGVELKQTVISHMNSRLQLIIPSRIDNYLQLLAEVYKESNNVTLQSLIINAKPILNECHEYDNWNGGTYGHLLVLEIPLKIFIQVESRLGEIERDILQRLNKFISLGNESICDVNIILSPSTINPNTDWRSESGLLLQQRVEVSPKKQEQLWKKGTYRIFLSHKTEDKVNTAILKRDLSLYGIDCFVAHEDIEPTQEWAKEIEAALFSADACVALMTELYHNSYWTDHEIGCAYGLQIPVIPVRLGCDPYGIIARFQAIRSTWTDLKMDLMKVLSKYDKVKITLIDAIRN
ncbi:MAG: toll/interleukin-1 receptor domain-containing protein, partial [Akkermansia sp.]|nr:toll/interleukin-1 receptor domain-containing protein [Akkermansia sp.]